MNAHAEYLTYPGPSNLSRTLKAASHLGQAKLLITQQANETVAYRYRKHLRDTADRLQILIEFLDRIGRAEVRQ